MQRNPEQDGGRNRLHAVAGEDDPALVVAVGDVAGGQHEEQPGEEKRKPGITE